MTSPFGISPEDQVIHFRRSKNGNEECDIKIKNLTEYPTAFKFRTNDIKTYRVRPSTGIVMPGEYRTINVYKISEKKISNNDKVVLISTALGKDANVDNTNLETVWSNTPTDKEQKQSIIIGQTEDQSKFSFVGITHKLGIGEMYENSQEESEKKDSIQGEKESGERTNKLGFNKSQEEKPILSEITHKLGLDKNLHHDISPIPFIKKTLSKPKELIKRSMEHVKKPKEAHYVRRKFTSIAKYPGKLVRRTKSQLARAARKCRLTNFWVILVMCLPIILAVFCFLYWDDIEELWKPTYAKNHFSRHPLLAPFGY